MSIYEYDEEKHMATIREEGVEYGIEQGRINLVKKKMMKSKPLDVIAEELECEVEDIKRLYDSVMQCGVESSVEEIMEILKAKE